MTRGSDQRGATLVFAMLLLVVIFAIGALIIDLLRIERASRSLQRAADAAALAGASQFNRATGFFSSDVDAEGWRRAKRASLVALRMNPVFGDSEEILQSDAFGAPGGPDQDTNFEASEYGFTEFEFPKLKVRIQRIFYFREIFPPPPPQEARPVEYGLEGRLHGTCNPDDTATISPPGVPDGCCTGSIMVCQVANAVRVTLTLKSLPLLFGNFVGLSQLTTLTRTALGSAEIKSPDQTAEFCS